MHEPESEALIDYLGQPLEALTASISVTEVVRALQRHGPSADDDPEGLLEAFAVLDLTPEISRIAGGLDPRTLRSLDAIHLASALSVGDLQLEVVTYDDRLAGAAESHGLIVVQPGRLGGRQATAR